MKYPDRTHYSRKVFHRLANRVRDTGHVQPLPNQGKTIRRPVREEREVEVIAAALINPHISTRNITSDSGLSQSTVWRILNNNLFHPFHINLHQQLESRDFQRRMDFCTWLNNQNETFHREILFSDEATFKSNAEVNIHNVHYWATEN